MPSATDLERNQLRSGSWTDKEVPGTSRYRVPGTKMYEVWTEISMVTFQKLTSWLGNSKVCSSSTFAPADAALMGFVARNHTRFKLGMTSPGCGILHLGATGHSHHAIIQQKNLLTSHTSAPAMPTGTA